MSYYRDVYLKSEDWKNLRAAAIAIKATDGRCLICHIKNALDVHHTNYKKLHNVEVEDLVPLCRICHNEIHGLMEHPDCKTAGKQAMWDWAFKRAIMSRRPKPERLKNKTLLIDTRAMRAEFAELQYQKRALKRRIRERLTEIHTDDLESLLDVEDDLKSLTAYVCKI
jgi:hypothetical protein